MANRTPEEMVKEARMIVREDRGLNALPDLLVLSLEMSAAQCKKLDDLAHRVGQMSIQQRAGGRK